MYRALHKKTARIVGLSGQDYSIIFIANILTNTATINEKHEIELK
jgi:hypothetical protein